MSGRRRRRPRHSTRGAGERPAGPPPRDPGAASGSGATGDERGNTRRRIARRAVPLAIGIVALAAGVIWLATRTRELPPRIALPLAAPHAAPAVSSDDFAGAAACADCHSREFDAWRASTHGRAGSMPVRRDLLLSRFDGQPIRFRNATVTPRADADGYAFEIARDGEPVEVIRIAGVVGGGHMAGGGTQGFVTAYPDGTFRFLPFELAQREGVWFCNTGTRLNRGWLPITQSMSLADCGDWPPIRVLADHPRFANCQNCHGSGIAVAAEPGKPHATRVRSLAIDCESCHGPGRRHVEMARGGGMGDSVDIGMRPLATLSRDASLDICLACHAVKSEVRPGYSAGTRLRDFYSLALPQLDDAPMFPDGRVRSFSYQQSHLLSACYLDGSMTCVDCHDPHSQQYRDVYRRPLAGRFDDRQCTACHASKALEPQRHTHHTEASAGSGCVACHMPYLQEPEVGTALRYARSDHTIPVPRPAYDASLGIEVACQSCHADATVTELQRQVNRWYGALKPRRPVIAALDSLRRHPDPAVEVALLLRSDRASSLVQFMVLGRVLRDVLTPDMPALKPRLDRRLRQLATSANDDVAAAALAALHLARGEDPDTRAFLAAALDSAGARAAPVRDRWIVLLGFVADTLRTGGEPRAAATVYRKALELRPDDPRVLLNLGLALASAGDWPAAIDAYNRSIAADSTGALAHVNLGIALAATGDIAGAERAYRTAARIDIGEPLPHFNLGNLYLRAGQPARAIDEYRQAVDLAPGLAPASFNLARAAMAVGDMDAARDALRQGLRFDSGNAAARQMLERIEQAMQRR